MKGIFVNQLSAQGVKYADLIVDGVKAHKLEVLQSKYFETFVKLYSGNYKFLCYQIEPGNKENAKITVFLERRETA